MQLVMQDHLAPSKPALSITMACQMHAHAQHADMKPVQHWGIVQEVLQEN